MSDFENYVIFACTGATLLVSVILWLFVRHMRERRKQRHQRRPGEEIDAKLATTLEELQEGQSARVVGRVEFAEQSIESPALGEQCVAYRLWIEYLQSSGVQGGGNVPRSVWNETRHVGSFFLVAGDERAVVDLKEAQFILDHERGTMTDREEGPDSRQRAILERSGLKQKGWLFWKRYHLKEGSIREGDQVEVYGCCTFERDPQPNAKGGYRGQARRKRIGASAESRVLVRKAVPRSN